MKKNVDDTQTPAGGSEGSAHCGSRHDSLVVYTCRRLGEVASPLPLHFLLTESENVTLT
jgi:hypothetical protein